MHLPIDSLLVMALGWATLLLGTKGFSRRGLPITSSVRWRGRVSIVIGAVCIVLGAMWILLGVWLGAGAPGN